MYVEVPELTRCCFCFPLRKGIVIFAYFNFITSIFAIGHLAKTTETKKNSNETYSIMEAVGSTVLFGVLGMGIILNVLLLFGAHQKDMRMLRLYNYYACVTVLAAVVPTAMLLYQRDVFDVCAILTAIIMQCYLVVLVRSGILKLEHGQNTNRAAQHEESTMNNEETTV